MHCMGRIISLSEDPPLEQCDVMEFFVSDTLTYQQGSRAPLDRVYNKSR